MILDFPQGIPLLRAMDGILPPQGRKWGKSSMLVKFAGVRMVFFVHHPYVSMPHL